jgi:5'-nucleotidase / UDP-sugar diphosphatase
MKIPRLTFLILLLLSFWLQAISQDKKQTNETEIVILHTNDMHAKIDNFAKLAYLADSLRKTHPNLFLVAAGDNFTGNPVVDMVADKGFPMIDLMNQCHFNASAVGNHEFDLGLEMLNKRFTQASFPFVCCNVNTKGTVLKQPAPYVVLPVGKKLKVILLGLIELGENGIPDSHPSKMTGLTFTDGVIAARPYASLKKKNTVLIGLSHLGLTGDVSLAKAMPQLDLIIGGHSHTLIDTPMVVNGVMITQAGSYLKYVGKCTLIVRDGVVISRKDEIIPMSKIHGKDARVQELVDRYNDNKEFSKVIAKTGQGINGYSELGSMMTDAIVEEMQVDFAFQNRGGIRTSSIPTGDIKLGDIYKLDPFGNQIVLFTMSLQEIQSLICNTFNREKGIDLEVAGMTYKVFADDKKHCIKVEMNDFRGQPLDESKKYKVGMNSYMAASYHFDHQDPGTTSYTTTAQALIDYLLKIQQVEYQGTIRTSVINN